MLWITIHETGNTSRGANARAHASYLGGNDAAAIPIAWHYTTDDRETIQHLPENETAFHAGDGANGIGNAQSIGIEMCINSDGNFSQTIDRTVALVADICRRRNIPIENIVPHNRWNGANCPRNIRAGNPINWNAFIGRVRAILGAGTPSQNTYKVVRGDTMTGIAQRFGVTLNALSAANPQITNIDRINVGQAINIPTGVATPRKTVEEVAQEIWRGQGDWGNDPQRKQRLIDYGGLEFRNAVQRRLNEIAAGR